VHGGFSLEENAERFEIVVMPQPNETAKRVWRFGYRLSAISFQGLNFFPIG
jgi:hypothetical protein